ncbi:DUF1015 domain-containing protein [Treponema sp. C6A8]|uniref:DUF1015 domain-containing protein n=1 Tax=Treponema sp. C6A8 TaxID=1410609 RepID=UPI000481776E|nr:DUF1015 domain-containing protein [Treponema sp. C6A8]
MKTINELGLRVPEILLPKNIDLKSWSVIACDQYTQDRDYWKKAAEAAGGKASTLNLILPEVYLNDGDKAERIDKIRQTMKSYLKSGVFDEARKAFVYLERTTAFGRTRKGLVAQIDLETYEWKPFSKANIRATEATIVDRIPPRKEIRKGAPLELPHIMLLVNDKDGLLVEGAGKLAHDGRAALYDGELMQNGGKITGWALETAGDLEYITGALNKIADANRAADGSTFLFAVGDGNHSLATAKAVWDEYKAELLAGGASEAELAENPVRFALIEIVNIYDAGLTFEPIHRVIFNADIEGLINKLGGALDGALREVASASELEAAVKASKADFGFVYLDKDGVQKYQLLQTKITELAVARFQPVVDEFLKEAGAGAGADGAKPEIDYIHGSEEVFRLGAQKGAVSVLLPPIAKDSFFETINGRGPLPRKSFSMGEADEKRFYLECRKLFN